MTSGALTDVAGISVGHFTDPRRPTGCTVVLCPDGAVAGVDVRGAAPGTREIALLSPVNAVEKVHAVLLAGGSAFGLDAAGGVMRWLEEREVGVEVGKTGAGERAGIPIRVPIVPAAILFDLWVGDPRIRPDAAAGYAACVAAGTTPPAEGSVGAGAGAAVGKLFGIGRAMKGGIGSASLQLGGATVAALIAVNAIGDVIDPATGTVVAGARSEDGSRPVGTTQSLLRGDASLPIQIGGATTIGVIATDALLTKAEATKLAQMAHDGLARSIDPVHTMSDGDTLFCLATGSARARPDLTLLGIAAAEATARAVLRAVTQAHGVGGPGLPTLPAVRDLPR
ncbi:MAG TPA: P1 family peptidase [Burkholderiaceae bacterium]|jgi:L-aminopeptidase/D-esterase-like protein|nr:P1 family peptidase [Burkholderiaceae bacterium]